MSTDINTVITDLKSTAATTNIARDVIDTVQSGLDVASNAASAAGDFYDDVKKLEDLAEAIESVTGVLSKFGPVGKIVSLLDDVIGTVENRIEALRKGAGTAENSFETLANTLDGANTSLSVVDVALADLSADIDGSISSLADTATLMERDWSDLNDTQNETLETADALIATLNDGRLDTAQTAITTVANAVGALPGMLDPIEDIAATFSAATKQLAKVTDKLKPLLGPLEAIETALSPVSWVLDKADWLVSKIIDPILDPILKATGITGLIEDVADSISSLLPSSTLFNPVSSLIATVQAGVAAVNPSTMLQQIEDAAIGRVLGESGVLGEVMGDGDEAANLVIGRNDALSTSSSLTGAGEDDVLSAGEGDDHLDGGAGNDIIIDGAGNDTYDGGDGADAVYFDTALENAEFVWEDGAVLVHHDGEVDRVENVETLLFQDTAFEIADADHIEVIDYADGNRELDGTTGDDALFGGELGDRINGRNGEDQLFGGEGNDTLKGGAKDDIVKGGAGKDKLLGGGGDDHIEGGSGVDILTGGKGADSFVFTGADVTGDRKGDIVRDFQQGQDVIDLTGLDGNANTDWVDGFTFISEGDFSGAAGELRITQTAERTIAEADLDGDGVADFGVRLNGQYDLGADDFLL